MPMRVLLLPAYSVQYWVHRAEFFTIIHFHLNTCFRYKAIVAALHLKPLLSDVL
jgi:hypothetical protein